MGLGWGGGRGGEDRGDRDEGGGNLAKTMLLTCQAIKGLFYSVCEAAGCTPGAGCRAFWPREDLVCTTYLVLTLHSHPVRSVFTVLSSFYLPRPFTQILHALSLPYSLLFTCPGLSLRSCTLCLYLILFLLPVLALHSNTASK